MRDASPGDHATIAALVESVTADFLGRGEAASLPELNCGLCLDVAEEIERSITGTPLSSMPGAVLQFEDFCIDPEGDSDEPGDIRMEAVSRHPGFLPPPGLTWDELNRLRFGERAVHAWIMVGDRHYDAETPHGVLNPFDLPCLRSLLVAGVGNDDPSFLAKLQEAHPWWSESREIAEARDAILGIERAPSP